MKLTRRLLQKTAKYLNHYSQFQPSPLSIQTFVDFGNGSDLSGSHEKSFQFLRKELPVRMANIMKEISLLPENLLHMPSVKSVKGWYDMSFNELTPFVDTDVTEEELNRFTKTLVHIRDRHSSVVETMAQGIIELKECGEIDPGTEKCIQYFLDRFYMNRISIRMLINQHTLLFGPHQAQHSRHIGCIDPKCNVRESVEDAYENAKFLCEQYYQTAPGLHIECRNPGEKGNPDVDIVYVPSHLYHMLFELFKNAMRATVEYNFEEPTLPSIKVLIIKGQEDMCIRMSDFGGGIARSHLDHLFHYMYSTAPQPVPQAEGGSVPLAGYGYGLPISRLYARYFHGDLVLNSIEGYGTDAQIYLKVLGTEASEVLPVYNRTAEKVYESDTPVNDWSSPQSWLPNHTSQRTYSTHTPRTKSPSPTTTTTTTTTPPPTHNDSPQKASLFR